MEPSFDAWTILFTIAVSQGVFVSLLLFARKSKTNHLLAALVLSFSFCLSYYIIFWTGYFRILPWQIGAAQGLTYLFGPLIYFYLRSDRKQTHFNFWHFVPFAIYVGTYLLFIPPRPILGIVLAIAQIVHLTIYTIINFYWLSNHKGYTNGALKRYKWRKKVAWAFAAYTASFILYYMLVVAGWLKVEYDYLISLAASFFIYFIGYHGFQKQEVFKMNEETRYNKSGLSSSASQSIAKKLSELMKTEKPYLESSLKLPDVADKLGFTHHHVSQAINESENKSFSDYINEFRINEAKALLSRSDMKIIEIAYSCGFNNKASFNNAFKRLTGMSPSNYREQSLVGIQGKI